MEYRLLDDDREYITIDLALAKAGPALLKACKQTNDFLGTLPYYSGSLARDLAKIERVLHAAIAKAEGG